MAATVALLGGVLNKDGDIQGDKMTSPPKLVLEIGPCLNQVLRDTP